MDYVGIIVGAAALVSATAALLGNINKSRVKKIDAVCNDVADMKKDIGIIKQASFYSLQAHVEQGANGDVKKTYEDLRDNVFKD